MSPIINFTGVAMLTMLILTMQPSFAFAQDDRPNAEYSGPNKLVSFVLPRAPNWAGIPYTVTALDTKGDRKYDKMMLHVDDFGQYLIVGVRIMPSTAVAQMNAENPETVLRNLSEATIMGWRTDFRVLPQIVRESISDSLHGTSLTRIYRASKGSILLKAEGRQPNQDDAFDTHIASMVAMHGPTVVFVIAQNDSNPDDVEKLVGMATGIFSDLKVKGKR